MSHAMRPCHNTGPTHELWSVLHELLHHCTLRPTPQCAFPAQQVSKEPIGRGEPMVCGSNCSENQKGILRMDGWTDSPSRNPTRHPTMRTLALDQQQQQQQPRTPLLAPTANSASPTC